MPRSNRITRVFVGRGRGTKEAAETMVDGEINVVSVEGGAFYFEPNIITAKKGETKKIVFSAIDLTHDFVIDDLGVQTEVIQGGNTTEIESVVDQAGEFEFYCSVGNHRAQGMVGTLIVE